MTRTIFIGDVHGCADELSELLDRLAVSAGDRVVFVGDLVTRGPDGPGVLRLLRQVGGSSVAGNHEQRMLHARATGNTSRYPGLSEDDWALLAALPLVLDYPEHGVRVVHAGVVPGRALADHDARLLTNLRTLDERGEPSERWHGRLWGERYVGPPHVVFGHNARARVQLHPWATGLDSGCVYGGALTAMVLRSGQMPPPPQERSDVLVSVAARAVYHLGASS